MNFSTGRLVRDPPVGALAPQWGVLGEPKARPANPWPWVADRRSGPRVGARSGTTSTYGGQPTTGAGGADGIRRSCTRRERDRFTSFPNGDSPPRSNPVLPLTPSRRRRYPPGLTHPLPKALASGRTSSKGAQAAPVRGIGGRAARPDPGALTGAGPRRGPSRRGAPAVDMGPAVEEVLELGAASSCGGSLPAGPAPRGRGRGPRGPGPRTVGSAASAGRPARRAPSWRSSRWRGPRLGGPAGAGGPGVVPPHHGLAAPARCCRKLAR